MIKKYILFFVLFLMVIAPALNVFESQALNYPDLYLSVALSLYSFTLRWPSEVCRVVKSFFITTIFLTTYFLIIGSLNGQIDSAIVSVLIRPLITVLAAISFSIILIKEFGRYSILYVFKSLVIICFLQGIVIWLSFISDEFRDFMSSIFYRTKVEGFLHLVELRVPGFATTGGDGLSLNHALLCILSALAINFIAHCRNLKILYTFLIYVSVISCALTGRSGFYLGILFISLVLVTFRLESLDFKRFYKILYVVIPFCVLLIIFLPLVAEFGIYLRSEYGYEHPIARLLYGLIELYAYGYYDDPTVNALAGDMIIINSNPFQLLFGVGNFGQTDINLIDSDIGYIRMLNGFGVFGMILYVVGLFLMPILVTYNFLLHTRSSNIDLISNRINSKYLFQILIIITIYGFVANWKIFYLNTRVFVFIFYMYVILLALRPLQKNNKSNL